MHGFEKSGIRLNTFYKKLFVPVLVLGICFRILLPFVLGKNPRQGDGDEYFRYAYHLYHSGIYSDEIEQPVHSTAGKMPGTSLLIYAAALIFGVDSALLILPNIFFSCMILFLIFLFIRKIELDSFLTLVLFSAFSFIPVIDFYSGQFYPEIPATFFSLWGFYLVYEFSVNRNFSFWIFANFSFAIACFFRPELAFTGIVVSAVSLLENSSLREKIKTAIVFPVCLIVLLTPWTIRNIISTGNASPMGENFFIENLQGGTRPERCAQGLYSWLNTWHFKEKHVKMVAWDFPGADLDALPPYAFSLPGEKSRLKSLQ